jgi:hypothetical protein
VIPIWRTVAYYRSHRPEAPSWPAQDPPPEVTSRDPRPEDAPQEPRAVLGLQGAAQGAGWQVAVTYSRGPQRAVRVGMYKRTETYGVWVGKHPSAPFRFSAMYTRELPDKAWKWRISIWRMDAAPVAPGLSARFTDASISDLLEFVQVRGSVMPAWFKAIHAREEDKKAKAKLAAKNRTAKPKEGSS